MTDKDGQDSSLSASVPVPILVLVSGFLGCGKTTLLLSAAALLRDRGVRVGIITNDQGGELVDTRLMVAAGFETEEISGGCFCCRFSDFMASAQRLLFTNPQVILAEPVGSCTDLSATIFEPIKRVYRDKFRLAPLTILVDPVRAADLLGSSADPDFAYLFHKQLAEADQIWFSKADSFRSFPDLPGVSAQKLSAHTGEGVREWLEQVLGGETSGARFLEIDYQRYAEAEAALGWLNWQAELHLDEALTPARVAGPMLEELEESLTQLGVTIAHLKIFCQAETGFLKASVCRGGEQPSVDGMLDAASAFEHEIVLNLRARAAPETLEAAVATVTGRLPGRLEVRHLQSFRPSPPKPEYRFSETL